MTTLMSALLAAQKQVGDIAPDKENKFANYKYVSAQKMVRECKRALNDNGLVPYIGNAGIEFDENGNMSVYAEFGLGLAFEAENGAHGTFQRYTMPLVKDKKPDDKIVLGVRTTLLRYWLRDLLMVPCDDKHDIDSRPDSLPSRRESRKAAPETLGTANARNLIEKMTARGLGMDALRAAVKAPDGSPDQWPKSLAPAIKKWIDAQPVQESQG